MAVSYNFAGPRIVKDGLVLYLDAGNPNSYNLSTPNVWRDISKRGNNGSLVNGPVFDSANGGVLTLDGVDDFIEIPNSTSLNPSYVTLFCWFRFRSTGPNLLIGSRSASQTGSYWLYKDSSRILFDTYPNSGYNRQQYNTVLNNNIWYNIVATYSSSSKIIYINSVAVSTTSGGTDLTSSSTTVKIGADSVIAPYRIPEDIGQICIYNRALSQAEITQNFNATRGRFGI
jgi:hypothetical protein